ncbi:unnamed protein product [Phytomonas sp. Hart1]|nr:unnamed protein product [Phytomonas sp. Hart1]|eukprot:CCW65986.1 unnamed protein product [Phytomonas sp. isolate Hart1]
MHTLKILYRAYSIILAQSQFEKKCQRRNMRVSGGGTVASIRRSTASARMCSTSITPNQCFRIHNIATPLKVHLGHFCAMEPIRPFSTSLTSTNTLRRSISLSRSGVKPKSRPKRNRSERRGPDAQTRNVLKTDLQTPKPSLDLNHDNDNDSRGRPATRTPDSMPSSTTPPEKTANTPGGMGWDYEMVDPVTGKTSIDLLYESHLDRIQQILERPLPPMPPDGHINPDFFVGFLYYNYRLRYQYRSTIAQELQLPVQAVKLSVAWSGRFDVSRFNQVQKVCGIYLDRGLLPGASSHSTGKAGPQDETDSRLSDAIQERMAALIQAINARRTPHLLQTQLFQASSAIPEVEFALSRREHRLRTHLYHWIHPNILGSSLAVIVQGGDLELYRAYARRGSGPVDPTPRASFDGPPTPAYAEWLTGEIDASARQGRFVDRHWLGQFHSREIIPRRLSLRGVAALVTWAILQGEVGPLRLPRHPEASLAEKNAGASQGGNPSGLSHEEEPGAAATQDEGLLSEAQVRLLEYCRDHLQSGVQRNQMEPEPRTGEEKGSVSSQMFSAEACLFGNDDFMHGLEQSLQSTALQWICTIRRALFLHDEGTSVADGFTSSGTSSISLPALFVHRAYAGGLVEMRYLRSNKAAMDALLLHPNDIVMKKAFARQLRNGYQRLRIYEEMDTSQSCG